MLEAGEEVRFLARRLVILASEDVGNADPQALPLAVAAMQACEFVGLPECQLTLAQAVAYLACAPKSNAATVAIGEARHDVREGRLVPVPRHLRDRHYSGAKRLGHGEGYQYAHNSAEGVALAGLFGHRSRILSAGRPGLRAGTGPSGWRRFAHCCAESRQATGQPRQIRRNSHRGWAKRSAGEAGEAGRYARVAGKPLFAGNSGHSCRHATRR